MTKIFTLTSGEVREYQQGVRLDGTDYVLKLSWNTRTEHWAMSLYLADATRTPIVEGRNVILFTNLLRGVVEVSTPPGYLIAFPTDGLPVRAGLTSLGGRVTLAYRTAAEVAADG